MKNKKDYKILCEIALYQAYNKWKTIIDGQKMA
jgi:hypothetical protein